MSIQKGKNYFQELKINILYQWPSIAHYSLTYFNFSKRQQEAGEPKPHRPHMSDAPGCFARTEWSHCSVFGCFHAPLFFYFFFISDDKGKFVTSIKTWAEINMQIMVPVWDAISLISIHWHNCVLQIYEFCKCYPLEKTVFGEYAFTSTISNNTWIHRGKKKKKR